jgi:hypothetical protein
VESFLERLENIFRNATSSDELFDAFSEAINVPVKDADFYKALLGNPTLSSDEIKMFSEKLAKEIPEQKLNTFMWTANVFEHHKDDYEKLDDAVNYYKRAFQVEPTNAAPLIKMLNLYNYEYDMQINKTIIDFVEEKVRSVNQKSETYFTFAQLYKRKGDYSLAAKYLALGEKAAERENF